MILKAGKAEVMWVFLQTIHSNNYVCVVENIYSTYYYKSQNMYTLLFPV